MTRRGVTLVEVLLVVAIMAMVASGVSLFAMPKYHEAQRSMSETSARVLRYAVLDWQRTRNERGCPTMDDLRGGKHVDSASELEDAWGTEYIVTCLPEDVMVASRGPDRLAWSGDDIVVPDLRHLADPFKGGMVQPSVGWAPDAGVSLEEWLTSKAAASGEHQGAPAASPSTTTVNVAPRAAD